MTSPLLSVWLYDEHVGHLSQTDNGSLTFQYTSNAQMPLSLSMPIQKEPYEGKAAEAFFGGLLPESAQARQWIGKQAHTSPNNTLGLLRVLGEDCAGAVVISERSEEQSQNHLQKKSGLAYRLLSETELAQYIRELPKRPLFYGIDGLRLSLAGAQDKAAVCWVENQVALPQWHQPTTHLIKPPIATIPGSVTNEAFCLTLAKRVGIDTPFCEIRYAEDILYLWIERYDRIISKTMSRRLHQEDGCQALGVLSSQKYQAEGGPTLADMFKLMYQTHQPAKARQALLDRVLFNVLIGNHDAHGKNFAVLYHQEGRIELAPFYDVLCTAIYPELSSKMAMKLGGKYGFDDVYERHWQRFAESCELSFPYVKKRLKGISRAMLNESETIKLDDPESVLPLIRELLFQRVNQVIERLF